MEWYEKFISGLQAELEGTEFGSAEYYKILDILERVQTMKLKEDHAVNEAVEEYNRSEAARKSERKRFWADILRIAVPVGGSLLMLILVMMFEQSGKIVPQRFVTWMIKPKV